MQLEASNTIQEGTLAQVQPSQAFQPPRHHINPCFQINSITIEIPAFKSDMNNRINLSLGNCKDIAHLVEGVVDVRDPLDLLLDSTDIFDFG